jgi:hypothetical protein
MTSQDTNESGDNKQGKLLSAQERIAFKMISAGNDLHGQRAIALLEIDAGASQAQAAQQAGLTLGQVKYWLAKFREVRMEIFPETLLEAGQKSLEPDMTADSIVPANQLIGSKKTQKVERKRKSKKKNKSKPAKKLKDKKKKKRNKKKKGKSKKKKSKK